MEFVVSLLERLGQAVIGLLLNPFYYLSILIVGLQMRRLIFFERKLYHSRIHTLLGESVRIVLWGMLAGVIGSVLMAFVGASLQAEAVIYIWVLALMLALFRVRFLCFAYAVGLLGVAHAILGWVTLDEGAAWYAWIAPITKLHLPSLLVLVGVVHILEAMLVRIQGERLATPTFIEGKRGKLIGSYQFQGLWPVPLFLLVPATASSGQAWPLMPLLGGADVWSAGWMFLAMPIMIGFSDITVSMTPKQKSVRSFGQLLLYGLIVIGLGLLAEWLPIFILPAALLTIVLHELLTWFAQWDERNRSPIYVHSARGLTVLAVLPNSAAKALGIKAGEVIHKVNGMPVKTKEELHQALRRNPAFTRLEIIDLAGQPRFEQRAMFEGEHHQLGIILSPDEDAEFYVKPKQFNMFRKLRAALGNQQQDRSISG